jgi:hypothetical protein
LGLVSLLDLTLLPIRIARHIADVVVHPEPQLPTPAGWPFGEEFPRTGGTARRAGGALFWTDFLYDDHGATGLPIGDVRIQAPPAGTYVYPDGPAAGNGADIFRVAMGLTETHTWWRIDWNTLLDAAVPIALAARRGAVAQVDARSYARPDPTHTITHHRGIVGHFDPTPGLYCELDWRVGPPVGPLPYLTLRLNGVGSLTVDVERAGLAALPSSTISVATETATQITLGGLGAGVVVQVDGQPAGPSVALLPGRHRIDLIGKAVTP